MLKTVDKSMLLPFDFSEYFNSLSSMEQLCVGLLLLNFGLFMVVLNFISLSFGSYLINRFKLESRYPKLYMFIQLRKKFERYYTIYSLCYLLFVMSVEILFSLAVLLNW